MLDVELREDAPASSTDIEAVRDGRCVREYPKKGDIAAVACGRRLLRAGVPGLRLGTGATQVQVTSRCATAPLDSVAQIGS